VNDDQGGLNIYSAYKLDIVFRRCTRSRMTAIKQAIRSLGLTT